MARTYLQRVYLESDLKKQAWGKRKIDMKKDKNSVQKYIMEAAAVNDRGLVLPGHLAAMQTVFQNGPHEEQENEARIPGFCLHWLVGW